jgi:hypothetical protein
MAFRKNKKYAISEAIAKSTLDTFRKSAPQTAANSIGAEVIFWMCVFFLPILLVSCDIL